MRHVWAALGLLALALGVIGLFLPFLPTVPFLLLAAFFFGRSSPKLHRWLLTHPTFGPPIQNWNARGAISRRAKILASLSAGAALGMSLLLGFSGQIIVFQSIAMVGVLAFIWTRPDD